MRCGKAQVDNRCQSPFQYLQPRVIVAVDRAESLSIMGCRELLAQHLADVARAERMPADVNTLLLQLNAYYSEMGQKATTDLDEMRAHGNEIVNILETVDAQVYYQQDKDWFYRSEERRWITMNDHSSWRRIERVAGKARRSLLHVA